MLRLHTQPPEPARSDRIDKLLTLASEYGLTVMVEAEAEESLGKSLSDLTRGETDLVETKVLAMIALMRLKDECGGLVN